MDSILFFFTIWNLILVLFHKYTHRYFELMYLSYITFMVGVYFSTVNPRKIVFKNLVIDKWYDLLIIDLIFHFGVFLFVYFKYYEYYKNTNTNIMLLSSVALLILYICMINPEKIYGINLLEMLIVIAVVNLLYFVIF